MDTREMLSRQGHRRLQIGVALFLTSFEGFTIEHMASPPAGRSTHSLSALLGVMLLALGLVWPRLELGATASRIAYWFLVHSGLAIVARVLARRRLGSWARVDAACRSATGNGAARSDHRGDRVLVRPRSSLSGSRASTGNC